MRQRRGSGIRWVRSPPRAYTMHPVTLFRIEVQVPIRLQIRHTPESWPSGAEPPPSTIANCGRIQKKKGKEEGRWRKGKKEGKSKEDVWAAGKARIGMRVRRKMGLAV